MKPHLKFLPGAAAPKQSFGSTQLEIDHSEEQICCRKEPTGLVWHSFHSTSVFLASNQVKTSLDAHSCH